MSVPVFDCHCDTATHALEKGEILRRNKMQLDLERLAAYAPAGQVFAICAVDDPDPVAFADRSIAFFLRQIEKNFDRRCRADRGYRRCICARCENSTPYLEP